jgi:hypothetical protein
MTDLGSGTTNITLPVVGFEIVLERKCGGQKVGRTEELSEKVWRGYEMG